MSVKTIIKSTIIFVVILMVGAFVLNGTAVAGVNEEKAAIEKPKAAIEKVVIEKVQMEPAAVDSSSAAPRSEPLLIRNPFLFEGLNPFLFEEGLIGAEGIGFE